MRVISEQYWLIRTDWFGKWWRRCFTQTARGGQRRMYTQKRTSKPALQQKTTTDDECTERHRERVSWFELLGTDFSRYSHVEAVTLKATMFYTLKAIVRTGVPDTQLFHFYLAVKCIITNVRFWVFECQFLCTQCHCCFCCCFGYYFNRHLLTY